MTHMECSEARAMDLEDLAKRFVAAEIPYVDYESSSLAPDECLVAKALIVIYEALHRREQADLGDQITRVLDLT